ncbi:hypothetical protein EXIGLDRAFT_717553 [Exidia glandulosa HHB12029]|uniref:Uncharacterized protein n=1 Tax=Exidia glandulosa HHB12029 TaxID=1314781 RepID=A0A165IAK6_EXIGL|nr:hypothetical protein EXIGLDRAFT_717553 [Exidia glandulosa HHB12029]
MRFSLGRPVAFSTPTRARKVFQQGEDMMDVDEPVVAPPLFSVPPSQNISSSRKTHDSAPSPFALSASVSTIKPVLDARTLVQDSSPLRYATPEPAPAPLQVPSDLEALADDERHADHQAGDGQGDPSPASSGGDELRDMFNVLGLDEDERWAHVSSEGNFSLDLFQARSPSTVEREHNTRANASSGVLRRMVRFAAPTIKMRTMSSPLKPGSSGSEDELLLKEGDVWVDNDV